MPSSVVIIGAGQAGFQTAASLRQEGFAGTIALIGEEPGLPYQRPPLSKSYLLGKTDAAGLAFRPAKFFEEHRIDLVHGAAVGLDRTNHRVVMRSGPALPYDHLVLATGARNRALPVPGADLDGVFGLRHRADADALMGRLRGARDVVVVGAGFIGLEFAAVARAAGATVHVLELADRPMARALSSGMSAFFAEAHRSRGVTLDLGLGLQCVLGGYRVTGVEVTGGRHLPADLVVFGIGVVPNIQLAADAGLEIENGVKVDGFLLTSDPAISAIGDCASFPERETGRTIRLESVQNATDQARSVAARLAGRPSPYVAVPWFWSDQYDLKLQMVGLSEGYDAAIRIGASHEDGFSILLFRQDRLIAVECVNRPGDFMVARKLLARPDALPLREAASEGFDLRAWAAR